MESDERRDARESVVASAPASNFRGEGGLPPGDRGGSGEVHDGCGAVLCDGVRAALPPPTTMANDARAAATAPANHISPATPMLPPVAIAGASVTDGATPSSAHSQESRTLALLYQSSRRSRTPWANAPRAAQAQAALPPPPPLFAAPPAPASADPSGPPHPDRGPASRLSAGAGADEVRKVSLCSSAASSVFHESWNTSTGSLVTSSFLNPSPGNAHDPHAAPPLPGPGHGGGSGRSARRPSAPPDLGNYTMEDADVEGRARSRGAIPTVPTLSGDSVPSSGNVPADEPSSLQVRTREEFEPPRHRGTTGSRPDGEPASTDDEGRARGGDEIADAFRDDGGENNSPEPPKKKKMKNALPPDGASERDRAGDHDLAPQTPKTPKSCGSTASFDIVAQPSSHVSSIHDDVHYNVGAPFESVQESMRKGANVNEVFQVDAEKDHEMGVLRTREEEGRRGRGRSRPKVARNEGSRSRKDRRILRRKIQRLLLIRHCSRCRVPNLPPATEPSPPDRCVSCDDGPSRELAARPPGAVCPVTSHCAEGKALCAHIRRCKRKDCAYPKCLTSREVMGHFKSCRDAACEICGPVRELERRRRGRGQARTGGRTSRSESNSSIETIDDEGWLAANMKEAYDLVGDTPRPGPRG